MPEPARSPNHRHHLQLTQLCTAQEFVFRPLTKRMHFLDGKLDYADSLLDDLFHLMVSQAVVNAGLAVLTSGSLQRPARIPSM